jgi:iron complex outermembrane receptor protein
MKSKYQGYETIDDARPELGLLDLSGNRLLQAPKFNIESSAQYSWDLAGFAKASLSGTWKHKGKIYFSAFNDDADAQDKVDLFDASFGLDDIDGRWSARAFIRNITNKLVRSNAVTVSYFLGPPTLGSYLPPRQYGVTLGYNF